MRWISLQINSIDKQILGKGIMNLQIVFSTKSKKILNFHQNPKQNCKFLQYQQDIHLNLKYIYEIIQILISKE